MEDNVNTVTDQTIDDILSNATTPVLVDFWAEWCGPCRMLGPIFEQLSSEYDGKVAFYKLNVDDNPETARKYHVMSIPTLLLFKGGAVAATMTGFKSKEDLKKWIDAA
jgi:thioredoxin 1